MILPHPHWEETDHSCHAGSAAAVCCLFLTRHHADCQTEWQGLACRLNSSHVMRPSARHLSELDSQPPPQTDSQPDSLHDLGPCHQRRNQVCKECKHTKLMACGIQRLSMPWEDFKPQMQPHTAARLVFTQKSFENFHFDVENFRQKFVANLFVGRTTSTECVRFPECSS